jgi:hypothetical protein
MASLSQDHNAIIMKVYRIVLGSAAVLAFVASIFPRSSGGGGDILYLFLWPLLVLQIILARLHWERFCVKNPGITYAFAVAVGFYAFFIDVLVFQLAGYLAPSH